MAIYPVKRLLTITECDAALKKADQLISDLEFKTAKLRRRLDMHHRMVSNATAERTSLEIDLAVFHAGLSAIEEGSLSQKYHYKINRVLRRIQQLNLRLEKYSAPLQLAKELKLRQEAIGLQEAKQLKTMLEARRAELLPAATDSIQPAVSRKLAPVIPLIPAQNSPSEPEHPTRPQPVVRMLKNRRENGERT